MSVNKVNPSTGELERVAGGTLYADAPIGTISPFGGSVIPNGYLLCDGAEVLKTTYPELYAVIGDVFGTASDNTKFVLPDLRESVPVGSGTRGSGVAEHDTYDVGEFKDDQLQNHRHYEASAAGGTSQVWGNIASADGMDSGWYTGIVKEGRKGTTTHGKQLGVNYIIKAKQVAVPFDVAEYIRNQNVLSNIETATLPMTAPYDGELIAVASNGGYVTFSINGSQYTVGSVTGMTYTSGLSIKKGDVLTLESLIGASGFTARYYKLRDYSGR